MKEKHLCSDVVSSAIDNSHKNIKKKQQQRIATWDEGKVKKRIHEIVSTLEGPKETLSKSRRKLLYSKLAKLRRAEKGEIVVGGQLNKKEKIRRKASKPHSVYSNRWKECLCCRKKGHIVQECLENLQLNAVSESQGSPMTKSSSKVNNGEAACFNCGETGHTLWNCNKKKPSDGSLPFATCFICHEKGHLSSKCPENTTGIYPKGGACHSCGSLYHLMKDCPTRGVISDGTSNCPISEKSRSAKRFNAYVNDQKQTKASLPFEKLVQDNDEYWN